MGILGLTLTLHSVRASDLFDQAQKDYSFQLEKYRDAYRDFDLKRGQYHNLQTFASQDSMVKAAATMLSHRDEVWYAYLQDLRVQLSETDGLQPALKDVLVQKIVDWEAVVTANKDQATQATTIEAVTQVAQSLDTQGVVMQSFGYEVAANVVWGHIQSSITHANDLSLQLKAAVSKQIYDETVKTTRLNGFTEVDKSLALAQSTLDSVRAERMQFGSAYDVSTEYKKVVDELTPAYEQVQRASTLLHELSAGVEL